MALSATELRIGNYIKDPRHPERIARVFRLTCGNNWFITYQYGKAFEDGAEDSSIFEPIPLTEEWLLKFGFQQQHKNINWWNMPKESNYKAHHLMKMQNAWTWFIDFDDCTVGNDCHLVKIFDYVHSLQNLYFALTGGELRQGIYD